MQRILFKFIIILTLGMVASGVFWWLVSASQIAQPDAIGFILVSVMAMLFCEPLV